MSFVALPRAAHKGWQIGVASGICGAAIAVALSVTLFSLHKADVAPIMVAALPAPPSQTDARPAPKAKEQPYDIRLDASSLAPPDEAALIADQLPANIIIPQSGNQRSLPPTMTISIGENSRALQPTPGVDRRAAEQAGLARDALRRGDISEAIMRQSQAVTAAPNNAMLRLELAVMYDRAGDRRQAVDSYAQTLRAFDVRRDAAPLSFDAEPVRRRLAYLKNGLID